MLCENSIPIVEFVDLHNKAIKRKINKKLLAKNLREVVKNSIVTMRLTESLNIHFKLPCVVEEINFGNIDFKLDIQQVLQDLEEGRDEMIEYDENDIEIMCDYFHMECTSDSYDSKRNSCNAPNISYGGPCFGGFQNQLAFAFLECDYASISNTLIDYIGTMDRESHYFYSAACRIVKSCHVCGDIIKPHVYINESNMNKNLGCSKCKK